MTEKRPRTEEADSDIERRWVVMAQPKPKTSPAINTLILILIFAALCAAVYLNRARLGALWQQVTGRAPPLQVMPEKPEREGPEIEGRDF
jgi:fatty acid desaturase